LAIIGLLVVGLLSSAIWMLRSGRRMYMYHNEIVGGLSGAQYKYETDLWQISIIDALKQLDKKELAQLKDTAIIITNGYSGVDYYLKRI
jgi:hypothetical protein